MVSFIYCYRIQSSVSDLSKQGVPDQTLKECFSSSQMQPFLPDDLMVEPNFAEWEVKFSCVDVSLSKNVMQMELLWTFFFLMFSRGKR